MVTCVRVPLEDSSCPGCTTPGLIFNVEDLLLAWSLGCQHDVLMKRSGTASLEGCSLARPYRLLLKKKKTRTDWSTPCLPCLRVRGGCLSGTITAGLCCHCSAIAFPSLGPGL